MQLLGHFLRLMAVVSFTISGLINVTNAQDRLPGFARKPIKSRLPGFGASSEYLSLVKGVDTNQARSWMKQYDKDGSGALEQAETASWSASAHTLYDRNSDGIIYERELAIGIAISRVKGEQQARDKAKAKAKTAKKPAPKKAATSSAPRRPIDPLVRSRQITCNNLAAELIAQYDKNGNKQLELKEWVATDSPFGAFSDGADKNGDRKITSRELAEWLRRRLPPLATSRLAKPLRLSDLDGDGQITLGEFAAQPTKEKVKQFRELDQNDDGLISPRESYSNPPPDGSVGFSSNDPRFITNKGSVYSTIWIGEELKIEDIDVRVAITKPNDDKLHLQLIGPNGQKVTLFAGGWVPWATSHIFESTIIDDEAPEIKTKLPRAPYPCKIRTDALRKGEPGLAQFYGKSSRGTWRLVAVNLNEKVGVLHHWSIWIKPRNKGG